MFAIPIVGWLIGFLFAIFLSIPFWLVWTVGGIGMTFFSWLPEAFHAPGFWSIVGLFVCLEIIRSILIPRPWKDSDD